MPVVHVVLVEPEIAPNTGNIIRLCAITGTDLHLVEPLGFELSDRLLKRGGLDYHERANVTVHADLDSVSAQLTGRWFTFSSRSTTSFASVSFESDDVLVFGGERAGLSEDVVCRFAEDRRLTIPMRPGNRSLNLANAAAIVVYEAWRQHGYEGATLDGVTALTSETPAAEPFDP